MERRLRRAMCAHSQDAPGRGQERRNAGPGAPAYGEVDCLVGGIVVTYQEIASRVKRCTEARQEWYSMVYPQVGPRTAEQSARIAGARHERGTYPRPRRRDAEDERSLNLERLGSLWREMRRANPGAMSSDHLVGRVRDSRKYRNGVAHARRTCGNAAVRNDRHNKTYESGTLAGYLGRMGATLGHVNQLYAHLRLVPME